MKLQPGDYVNAREITHEQYLDVGEAFIEAGAPFGEFPNEEWFNRFNTFGWHPAHGLYHGKLSKNREWNNCRKLSYEEIFAKDWDGTGLPPVGAVVEYANACPTDPEPLCNWRSGDPLEVIAHKDDVVVVWNARANSASGLWPLFLGELTMRPRETQKEKGIKALALAIKGASKVTTSSGEARHIAERLYERGYRKVSDDCASVQNERRVK